MKIIKFSQTQCCSLRWRGFAHALSILFDLVCVFLHRASALNRDLGVGHCFKRSMLLFAAVQQFLCQLSVCGLTWNKWRACVKQKVFLYSTCVTFNVSLSVRSITKRLISNSETADFLVSSSYILPMTLTPTSKNRGLYALFDQSPTPNIILFCPFLLSLQSFVVLSVYRVRNRNKLRFRRELLCWVVEPCGFHFIATWTSLFCSSIRSPKFWVL